MRAVAADLASLQRAHRATVEGATHEEAKPENDKDTRALEQSYLARGQSNERRSSARASQRSAGWASKLHAGPARGGGRAGHR